MIGSLHLAGWKGVYDLGTPGVIVGGGVYYLGTPLKVYEAEDTPFSSRPHLSAYELERGGSLHSALLQARGWTRTQP